MTTTHSPLEFRELSARGDAEEIACCLGLLYTELFGLGAVLSDEEFHAAIEQWEQAEQKGSTKGVRFIYPWKIGENVPAPIFCFLDPLCLIK